MKIIEFLQGHNFNIVFIALFMYLYKKKFKITPKMEFYENFEQTTIYVYTLEHPRFTCLHYFKFIIHNKKC